MILYHFTDFWFLKNGGTILQEGLKAGPSDESFPPTNVVWLTTSPVAVWATRPPECRISVVIPSHPLVTLDRNERVRLMWKFRMLTRRSWVAKESGRHRGVITRTAESVFGALLYLTEKYGRVFPSLEGLAHLSMCCKQSVVTAIANLEALGFVTRIRRIRRITTPLGFTTRQITNAYRVHEPVSGLGLLATLVFATEYNYSTPSTHTVDPKGCESALDPTNSLHQALLRLGRALGSEERSRA
jgi:Helix-turn-helix domain